MNEMRHRTHPQPVVAWLRRPLRVAGMLVLAVVLSVTGFLAAGASAGAAGSQSAGSQSNATLSLRQTNLGRILVSAKGRTLYLFMKDRNGKSACTGSCVSYWPPLLKTGKLTVATGVKRASIGTTKRADGRLQVTYNKHPLYTFALDRSAGQTNGQATSNFGAKWYAVSANGRAVVRAPTPTTTDTTTTTTTTPYPPYP